MDKAINIVMWTLAALTMIINGAWAIVALQNK